MIGALQHVGQAIEADLRLGELLGDDRQRGAGGAADAERQMAGVPAHHGDEEPALGGGRVLHEVADQLLAEVAGGGEAEGHDVARQRQVVVDRLGHVGDGQPLHRLGQPRGREGRVVAADRDQVVDPQALEGLGHLGDALRRPGGVRARGADDGAAVEVDAGGVVDLQLDDVLDVALDQPLEAVVAAEHAQPMVARLDGGGRDDRVDARGGTTTYEDRQRLHDALRRSIVREGRNGGQQTPGRPTAWTSRTGGCPGSGAGRRGQRVGWIT